MMQRSSKTRAFMHGAFGAPSIPVLVVTVTFIGFGALARDTGLDVFQALFVTLSVFALPGQVVLADEAAKGSGLAAVAFAVMLTSVRLLPMSYSLFPVMRAKNTPLWLEIILSHFVAITVWLEAMRRLPKQHKELRVAYFSGFAVAMMAGLLTATVAGYFLAARVPPPVAAGMVFLTPVYFFLSLLESSQNIADRGAVLAGVILGPLLFLVIPGLDLVLTGLIGGTACYGFMKWREKSDRGRP